MTTRLIYEMQPLLNLLY